jgi:sigma-B regulation protein RsbU (phosphoserine phosphatase)
LLVLYTDGLTEAINSEQEEFGVAWLRQTILDQGQRRDASASGLVAAIEQTLDEFVGEEKPFDDVTMLAVKAGRTR